MSQSVNHRQKKKKISQSVISIPKSMLSTSLTTTCGVLIKKNKTEKGKT